MFKLLILRNYWIDINTGLQYDARVAINPHDIKGIQEYVYTDGIKANGPLCHIFTYDGDNFVVEERFEKLVEIRNKYLMDSLIIKLN